MNVPSNLNHNKKAQSMMTGLLFDWLTQMRLLSSFCDERHRILASRRAKAQLNLALERVHRRQSRRMHRQLQTRSHRIKSFRLSHQNQNIGAV